MSKKELEIYIHIPFCVKKCEYCDFLSFSKYNNKYVKALIDEINLCNLEGMDAYDYEVRTIFIGGGTPSVLKGDEIALILSQINKKFALSKEAEITIEANPGTITKEKLEAYKEAGINRISIGLQSAVEEELKELGRIHTFEEFLKNYELARSVGFHNINIDLMSAIPKQSVESWKETLEKIISLQPEHISAYSLIIEEGTNFYEKWSSGLLVLPSEEEERQMYYDTKRILKQAGYERYEISNYSKSGFECKHNIGYWKRIDYIGFGLGSSSLINNKRFTNESDMNRYLESIASGGKHLHQNIQILSQKEQMEEFMFLGLRLIKGVSVDHFKKTFHKDFDEVYGECSKKLIQQGLIERKEDRTFLTEKGLDVSNYVMAEFLLSK